MIESAIRPVSPGEKNGWWPMPGTISSCAAGICAASASRALGGTSGSSLPCRTKVGKVMREYKQGKLKSGGKRKVKSRKQAIAIGISEARKSGAKVPRKKAA